jgi:hypothetical protein
VPAKVILPARADKSARTEAKGSLLSAIATLDETLEVNAIARDALASARKGRSVSRASRLAVDKALGQLALASESTARALAHAERAAGVTS